MLRHMLKFLYKVPEWADCKNFCLERLIFSILLSEELHTMNYCWRVLSRSSFQLKKF